jgi:hypothetical protein
MTEPAPTSDAVPGPLAPTPPEAAPEAAPPPESPRTRDWRPGLRWFAAEFLVVVSGILVALALNAWWSARADRAQEQAYLLQLAADLAATEAVAARADSLSRPFDRAGTQLTRAVFAEERPPRDSLLTWYLTAVNYAPLPQPVLGTATALVETGDLNLIRDDSLRSAITTYAETSRAFADEQRRFTAYFLEGITPLFGRLTVWEAIAEQTPPLVLDSLAAANPSFGLPPGPRRQPFDRDIDALLSDRDMLAAFEQMSIAKRNLLVMRAGMRTQAEALREHVEAELAR